MLKQRATLAGIAASFLLWAAQANAAGWLQTEGNSGANGHYQTGISFMVQVSSAWNAGVSGAMWRNDALSGAAPSASIFVNRYFGSWILGLRPFIYPNTEASPGRAHGAALSLAKNFEDEENENSWTQMTITSAYAALNAELSGPAEPAAIAKLSEYAANLSLEKVWYNQFVAGISGTGYLFNRGFAGMSAARSPLLQRELSPLGTRAPLRDLPEYAVGMRVVRASSEDLSDAFVSMSYERIVFRVPLRHAHSFLFGMDFPIANTWRMGFNYNHYRAIGAKPENHYALALRWLIQ